MLCFLDILQTPPKKEVVRPVGHFGDLLRVPMCIVLVGTLLNLQILWSPTVGPPKFVGSL